MSTDINWDSELKWRPESYTEFDDPVALVLNLSLIHISEPTRLGMISYAVFC